MFCCKQLSNKYPVTSKQQGKYGLFIVKSTMRLIHHVYIAWVS